MRCVSEPPVAHQLTGTVRVIITVPTVLDAGGAITVEMKYSCTKGDFALALSCSRNPMGWLTQQTREGEREG